MSLLHSCTICFETAECLHLRASHSPPGGSSELICHRYDLTGTTLILQEANGIFPLMRFSVVAGAIKRRILVNYRADPDVVKRILPEPFRPKLYKGNAVVGVCLIRLENIRPKGWPAIVGVSSENAAHRIAVEWDDQGRSREGVFIPRRDTGSMLNRLAGGRLFPGEHHSARFTVKDDGSHIDFKMKSKDEAVVVRLAGHQVEELPASSCFASLACASDFFEGGSLGYSVKNGSCQLDGLRLRTLDWRVAALSVSEVRSTFFNDRVRFPEGSLQFDHALIMRDLKHEWHQENDPVGNAKRPR